MTDPTLEEREEAQAISTLNEAPALSSVASLSSSIANPVAKHLPITRQERLGRASKRANDESGTSPTTVLYLAYGSNLCAETFQGKRGIRPLSAVNVIVPSLNLTFDLPGVPYNEPCFSTTNYRKTGGETPPEVAEDEKTRLIPRKLYSSGLENEASNPQWPHGLIGVVYEVTSSDFAHIIATEGGGASYQDIMVTCYALPKNIETAVNVSKAQPFMAHTLFTQPLPGKGEKKGPLGNRTPAYAQPSARYLKLIHDGAEEHLLPKDYLKYLDSIQPFLMTSKRQRLGKFVFSVVWMPWLFLLFRLTRSQAGPDGTTPKWVAWLLARLFEGIWRSYDAFFKGTFGDGERTVPPRTL